MSISLRAAPWLVLALALGAVSTPAQSHPRRWAGGVHVGHPFHHGHAGHRWHGGWGVGVGFGWWPMHPYGVVPGVVLVEPLPADRVRQRLPEPEPHAPSPPDPVFMPRSGQDAMQTEGDRQACNRFAMTQPSAMRDAAVFHQTVLACMAERDYAVR